MASEANLDERIGRLIDRGIVYYGQSTARLADVLRRESAGWVTTTPDGGRSPWGERSNEDLPSMILAAQQQLYGMAIPWELYSSVPARVRKRAAIEISRRGPRSPYALNPSDVVEFFLAALREGTEVSEKIDSRDLSRWVVTWKIFSGGAGLSVAEADEFCNVPEPVAEKLVKSGVDDIRGLASLFAWVERWAHATRRYIDHSWSILDLVELSEEMARVQPRLQRPLLVAWLHTDYRVDTAREWIRAVSKEPSPLAAIEEMIAAMDAIMETAAAW